MKATQVMRVEFVNHACVIIDTGVERILCDPWLSGTAFDDGWALAAQPSTPIEELDFTHIWISHEHPDHFSTRDLRSLPAERKANVPVLYQKTIDGKVAAYCREIGYPVIELQANQPLALSAGTHIECGIVSGYDSWLLVRAAGGTALNLNDCRLWEEQGLRQLSARAGRLDVLMTQFGHANWAGNEGDARTARHAARLVLEKMARQMEILRPEACIPFASFVLFCHEENFYWNEHAVTLDDAIAQCETAGVKPVAMFPGDHWTIGGSPPENAIRRWREAYVAARRRPLHRAASVTTDRLRQDFAHLQARVAAENDWNAIGRIKKEGLLPASPVFVTDLEKSFAFDLVEGLSPITATPEACDIRLGSAALANVIRHNWGRGTLTVNGRFQANYATFWRFLRQTQIPYANNIGWRFPDRLSREKLLAPGSFVLDLIRYGAGEPTSAE